MEWECPKCGCQGILPDITFCPHCFAPRDEEPETAEGKPEASEQKPTSDDDWGKS